MTANPPDAPSPLYSMSRLEIEAIIPEAPGPRSGTRTRGSAPTGKREPLLARFLLG
jgi:hypothetical protein